MKACPICGVNDPHHERMLAGHELVKCGTCGFVHANLEDEVIKAENAKNDELIARKYAAQQTILDTIWSGRIARKLTKLLGAGKVLDVGCGNGVLLRQFLKQGWDTYGVDLSPWAQRFAEEYGFTLYTGELETLGLPGDHFDAVTSTSVLEHIPTPREHVKAILRVLKPGGIAYFAGIPNYRSLSIRLNVSKFASNTPPGHASYFTINTMKHLFATPDIACDIKKMSIGSYGIPEAHRLYRWLLKGSRRALQRSRNAPDTAALSSSHSARTGYLQRLLASLPVSMNYHVGRPFGLGSVLEIIAVKR